MEELSTNSWLIVVSAICSIAGLALSLYLIHQAGKIDKKVKSILQQRDYNKHRKQYKNKLIGLMESISRDNIWDDDIIREITQQIRYYENFSSFFSIVDRYYVFVTLRHLKRGRNQINKDRLIHQATYFVSQYNIEK